MLRTAKTPQHSQLKNLTNFKNLKHEDHKSIKISIILQKQHPLRCI